MRRRTKKNTLRRIRGMSAFGAYINEGSTANNAVFKEVLSRCSEEGARVMIDTNQPNMQLSTVNTVSLFETTKEQRITFAQDFIARVKNGEINPVQCHLQLKCMEEIVNTIKSDAEYKSLTLDEASKHGKKFSAYNGEFEIKEMGVKYDYSVCNDDTYLSMVAEFAALEEKINAREKFLKNIPESGVADPENGNMIYPPAKTSTTTLTVKLP